MPIDPTSVLKAIIFGAGVMALLAISFGIVERSRIGFQWRSVIHGVLFGGGAVIVMLEPVHLGNGVIFDGRGIIVGMAAAFGGWPAALISGAFTVLYRAYLGGIGAPAGIFGILLAATLGLIWAWRWKPDGHVTLRLTALLGVILALQNFSAVLIPQPLFTQVVTTVVPVIVVCCIISAIVMGSLMERERQYIRSETLWKTSAHTDPLTALPNRRGFTENVAPKLTGNKVRDTTALLILDADNFKSVNDTYGHSAGDVALGLIAQKLHALADTDCNVCRLGGEEFAIFLSKTSRDEAEQIAETLRKDIQNAKFVYKGMSVPLSVSVGVAVHPSGSKTTLNCLLLSADKALYRAKAGGRNKVVCAQQLAA